MEEFIKGNLEGRKQIAKSLSGNRRKDFVSLCELLKMTGEPFSFFVTLEKIDAVSIFKDPVDGTEKRELLCTLNKT